MKHFGGKAPHRLTLYVEVLQTHVNKVNKAAICKACIDKSEREVALKSSIFTNMKACTKVYLKKCPNFFEKYNEEERNEILYGLDNESQETNTVLSVNSAASLSTSSSFIFTSSTSSESTTKTTKIYSIQYTKSKPSKSLINNHLVRDLNSAKYSRPPIQSPPI
ncbi:hypothetical protein F8M41_026471 [Gigaspora margarita]|uniref:Uncharacterized protein n=1 Tax=Gigaspora margarita TaxID=4874 RepID=A0A8H4AAI2_GIGMA|nr:hypothetical protein F8M41_026471 [Gigaspora margarita]